MISNITVKPLKRDSGTIVTLNIYQRTSCNDATDPYNVHKWRVKKCGADQDGVFLEGVSWKKKNVGCGGVMLSLIVQ